jgi:hypothetical protein
MNRERRLAIRWTVGDVSPLGFEALRLSIWGARKLFGKEAAYVVCVNSIPVSRARRLTGPVPAEVDWRDVTNELPPFVRSAFADNLAEGTGWKLAPLRLFPDRYELSLDNDCILWEMPLAIDEWLREGSANRFVIAEDVRRMFGAFSDRCGPEPRNAGIRGLPPHVEIETPLRDLLADCGELSSELDEQGLQVALVSQAEPALVVSLDEVTICSPFPPLLPHLGRCGAHFVGLNAKRLPWAYNGQPAHEVVREHWRRRRPALYERVGIRPTRIATSRLKNSDRVHR